MPEIEQKPQTPADPHFDKKLLALLFLVVMFCIMAISLYPLAGQTAQITLVTTLQGALAALMGGIITLTSGRSTQRTSDTKDGHTTTITDASDSDK